MRIKGDGYAVDIYRKPVHLIEISHKIVVFIHTFQGSFPCLLLKKSIRVFAVGAVFFKTVFIHFDLFVQPGYGSQF